jgi:hypothetical protein
VKHGPWAIPIDRIDGVPLRGEADRRIDPARSKDFDRAVACNGNGVERRFQRLEFGVEAAEE